MSNTDRGDGAEQNNTNQHGSEQTNADQTNTNQTNTSRTNADQTNTSQTNTNQHGSEQTNTDQTNTSRTSPTHADQRMVPVERTPEQSADRLSRQFAQESRLRILRSKAAVARSEVDALAAVHLDADTLEDLLDTATPREAERLRKSEHEISVRVAKAQERADAAEAAYEQAVLDDFDEAER
ncbi:hypothetical protein [Cryobacterium sp. TMT3-29-2]|uniref:hypothetical protein n=1 Tax=Cryobacterium sp. TMT3-29-2 TaxID=2555867 RepID=UPI0014322EC1|nr:hypothetical protein [Cryobacterium sp. TMT3-29-2]